MLSEQALNVYRRMTPGERLQLSFDATRRGLELMLEGPPEVVARRFQRLREENDARNRAIRETLGAAEGASDDRR
jgi:hypothetical protein